MKKKTKDEADIQTINEQEEIDSSKDFKNFNKYLMLHIRINKDNEDDKNLIKAQKLDTTITEDLIIDIFKIDDVLLYEKAFHIHMQDFNSDDKKDKKDSENYAKVTLTLDTYDEWYKFTSDQLHGTLQKVSGENPPFRLSMLELEPDEQLFTFIGDDKKPRVHDIYLSPFHANNTIQILTKRYGNYLNMLDQVKEFNIETWMTDLDSEKENA